MHIVVVSIHVKPESVAGFLEATLDNVRETLKEEGVARFDLLRESGDPTRFLLVEVYRKAEDHARHKESSHYQRWSSLAEPMMAESRTRKIYESVFAYESGWEWGKDAL